MKQDTLTAIIEDQTRRALWEVKNIIDCIPDELWNKNYCEMPCWKHVYHMLHSLDLWYINPRDRHFKEPDIHEKDLNNLDVVSSKSLSHTTFLSFDGPKESNPRDEYARPSSVYSLSFV